MLRPWNFKEGITRLSIVIGIILFSVGLYISGNFFEEVNSSVDNWS